MNYNLLKLDEVTIRAVIMKPKATSKRRPESEQVTRAESKDKSRSRMTAQGYTHFLLKRSEHATSKRRLEPEQMTRAASEVKS